MTGDWAESYPGGQSAIVHRAPNGSKGNQARAADGECASSTWVGSQAAARWGCAQKPSQSLEPLTYNARRAPTVAAPSSTQRIPEPFRRSPMILQPASVGPEPMS